MLKLLSLIVAVFQLIVPLTVNKIVGIDKLYTDWSQDSEYRLEDFASVEKDPDKDFVILNLTDTQLTGDEAICKSGRLLKNTIKELIEKTKPDLITLTGDNAWGDFAYIQIVNVLESYRIPWTPAFGNHDSSDSVAEWQSLLFTDSRHCLYRVGPRDMGYGNYAVNITENGKVVRSLIFMDTHSNATFTLSDGSKVSGYDHLWDNQIEWYKWAVNGVQKYGADGKVPSTVFFHIPVVEYKDAYEAAWDKTTSTYNEGYDAFGVNLEGVCCAPVNNGFFGVAKALGSTTDIICGHDHINSFSAVYQGIRLTYSLKTGCGCYWDESLNGGTQFTIDSAGKSTVKHIYVEPSYKWNFCEPALWAF